MSKLTRIPRTGRPAGLAARVSGSPLWEFLRRWRAWLIVKLEQERARRPPSSSDAPSAGVLVVLSVWAVTLALSGLVVGVAAGAALSSAPGWFGPTIVAVGLIGILATAAALVTANRRWLPWMMLCVGTVAVLSRRGWRRQPGRPSSATFVGVPRGLSPGPVGVAMAGCG